MSSFRRWKAKQESMYDDDFDAPCPDGPYKTLWVCSCGHSVTSSGNHCSKCGAAKGDWTCTCGEVVFVGRDFCRKCGRDKNGAQRQPQRPGDWICNKCGDLVFGSRASCRSCGQAKPLNHQQPQEQQQQPAQQFMQKPGDWICGCGELVFAKRLVENAETV
jgi:hypothetical protein